MRLSPNIFCETNNEGATDKSRLHIHNAFSFPGFPLRLFVSTRLLACMAIFLAGIFLFPLKGWSQMEFSPANDIPVVYQGDTLELGWAGGLNFCQLSALDINLDGTDDILVFDRSGDRIIPLIREQGYFQYHPEFLSVFPPLKSWVLAADYDGDGQKDLFTSRGNGIAVYRNTSVGGLSFSDIFPGETLTTDYTGPAVNLYVLARDLPAIEDIDGDGDLDILTFVDHYQGGVSSEYEP